jgi:hypothetical protein
MRRISRFSLASGQIVARVPGLGEEPGCAVELTEIRTCGEAWWSLGFEATGPAGQLRGELEASAALVFAETWPGGVEPGPDNSKSYAEWLYQWPVARCNADHSLLPLEVRPPGSGQLIRAYRLSAGAKKPPRVPETAATNSATGTRWRHHPLLGHVSGSESCAADHESADQLGDDLCLNSTDGDAGSAFGAALTTYFPAATTHLDYVPGQPTDWHGSPHACPAVRLAPSTDDPVIGGQRIGNTLARSAQNGGYRASSDR